MRDCTVLAEVQPSGMLNGLVKSGRDATSVGPTYAGDQVVEI